MERAAGQSLELLVLINRGAVRACGGPGAARGEYQLSCTMTPLRLHLVSRSMPWQIVPFPEYFFLFSFFLCVSRFWQLGVCLLFSFLLHPPPPPFPSSPLRVSDLVKCSRTAACRVLQQLINNSDNMIYVIHSPHKITVCNCLPNVFRACFFAFFSRLLHSKKKKKGLWPGRKTVGSLSKKLHTSVTWADGYIRMWSHCC